MRRYLALLAALVVALVITTTPAVAEVGTKTALVLYIPGSVCGDVMPQAVEDADLLLMAANVPSEDDIVLFGPEPIVSVSAEEVAEMGLGELSYNTRDEREGLRQDHFVDFSLLYAPKNKNWGASGSASVTNAIVGCEATVATRAGTHEWGHLLTGWGDRFHEQAWCQDGEFGLDATLHLCPARVLVDRFSDVNAAAIRTAFQAPPDPPSPTWLTSEAAPGFEFQVVITGAEAVLGSPEPCIPETFCASGALVGRPEVFVKIIGPRPNGYLWVQISRFTPSTVEVWIRQTSTGNEQYYFVPGIVGRPEVFQEIPGIIHKEAFLP